MFCVGWANRVEGSVCLWLAMIAFVWILTAFRTARMMNACPCASDISGSWLQRLESSERQGTQGLTRINLFKRRHIGAFPPITKSPPPKKRHKSSDLPTFYTPQTTQSLRLLFVADFRQPKKPFISTNLRVSLYGFMEPKRWNLKGSTWDFHGSTQAGTKCYPWQETHHKSLGDSVKKHRLKF